MHDPNICDITVRTTVTRQSYAREVRNTNFNIVFTNFRRLYEEIISVYQLNLAQRPMLYKSAILVIYL